VKRIKVNTIVENEACEERREFTYQGSRLTASVVMNKDKESYVWAYFYDADETWSISLGNLTISDISQKDMLKLLTVINEKTKEKIDVTSDDNT